MDASKLVGLVVEEVESRALHLATAIRRLHELDASVTDEDRPADAARALGLPVVRPD